MFDLMKQIKKLQQEILQEYTCNAYVRITGKYANKLTPQLYSLFYNPICSVRILCDAAPHTDRERRMIYRQLRILRKQLRKEFKKLKQEDSKKERN